MDHRVVSRSSTYECCQSETTGEYDDCLHLERQPDETARHASKARSTAAAVFGGKAGGEEGGFVVRSKQPQVFLALQDVATIGVSPVWRSCFSSACLCRSSVQHIRIKWKAANVSAVMKE